MMPKTFIFKPPPQGCAEVELAGADCLDLVDNIGLVRLYGPLALQVAQAQRARARAVKTAKPQDADDTQCTVGPWALPALHKCLRFQLAV